MEKRGKKRDFEISLSFKYLTSSHTLILLVHDFIQVSKIFFTTLDIHTDIGLDEIILKTD